MKLGFKEAKITSAKVLEPITGPHLGFTVRAPFTLALAKKLNLEELYGPDRLLRRFPYHGVNIELTEGSVTFFRGGKNGTEFACSAQIKEIIQKEAGKAEIEVRVELNAAESVNAYDFMFREAQPDDGWEGIGISGTYQERLPFDEEESDEGEP